MHYKDLLKLTHFYTIVKLYFKMYLLSTHMLMNLSVVENVFRLRRGVIGSSIG